MARPDRYSLRGRLLLTAGVVLFVFLGLTGLVLDQAFQRSAEEGVSERLLLHIYGLLAVTEESDGEIYLPEKLQEPDFNRPGTGLYGLVMTGKGEELWRSASSVDLEVQQDEKQHLYVDLATGVERFGRVKDTAGDSLFYASYRVLWQGSDKQNKAYVFTVLQTMDPYLSEIRGFRNNLWGWLLGVALVLIVVQAAVMSWGLTPLKKLARELKAIEDGDQDSLQEDYPAEINGVTRNLNLLLASERQQREKYRTTLADLAHSLKTPLAILRGASSTLEYVKEGGAGDLQKVQKTVDEQVEHMDQIVSYQLERAVATSSNLIRKSIDVKPVAERLVKAMNKVYEAGEINLELVADECSFFGDERDLMELLGNLVDNACKYGKRHVKITIGKPVDIVKAGSAEQATAVAIMVEDDGPGISPEHRDQVLTRGARADSREQGYGIGLAVVGEIVERYGGNIAIDESSLGGAKFTVTLP